MDLLKNRWLLVPVLILAGLFLLDKLFLLPEVRDNFLQAGGMIYYRQRIDQLGKAHDRLVKNEGNKKTLFVFGDSRSFAIGRDMLPAADKERWDIINYAGPQAVPAYHAFLVEQLTSVPPFPRYAVIGVSPDAFNRNSGVLGTPVLSFGVDAQFIKNNATHIPTRDMENYVSGRRWALAGMRFSMKDLLSRVAGSFQKDEPIVLPQANTDEGLAFQQMLRAAHPTLSLYSFAKSPERLILDKGDGAQYAWWGSAPPDKLQKDTERIVKLYLANFTIAQEEIYFFRKTMVRLRQAGVRTIVFWPRVNPYLLKAYEDEPRIRLLWKYLSEIARDEGALAIDLNYEKETACNQYYDASHLSVNCFRTITPFIVRRLEAGW